MLMTNCMFPLKQNLHHGRIMGSQESLLKNLVNAVNVVESIVIREDFKWVLG